MTVRTRLWYTGSHMYIIIGIVCIAAGFILVWKSEWFQVNFGSIQWAEEKFGSSGGSRLMYKLIGIAVIFIGFLMVTNLHKKFFVSVFGGLFGLNKEQQEEQYLE
jgi:multisubunit Na+/H+ antiporter MnhB subunit